MKTYTVLTYNHDDEKYTVNLTRTQAKRLARSVDCASIFIGSTKIATVRNGKFIPEYTGLSVLENDFLGGDYWRHVRYVRAEKYLSSKNT